MVMLHVVGRRKFGVESEVPCVYKFTSGKACGKVENQIVKKKKNIHRIDLFLCGSPLTLKSTE